MIGSIHPRFAVVLLTVLVLGGGAIYLLGPGQDGPGPNLDDGQWAPADDAFAAASPPSAPDAPSGPRAEPWDDPDLDIPVEPLRPQVLDPLRQYFADVAEVCLALANSLRPVQDAGSMAAAQAQVLRANDRMGELARGFGELPDTPNSAEIARLAGDEGRDARDGLARLVGELERLATYGWAPPLLRDAVAAYKDQRSRLDQLLSPPKPQYIGVRFWATHGDEHRQAVLDALGLLTDAPALQWGGNISINGSTGEVRAKLQPVVDPQTYAERLAFGSVRSISGRRIEFEPAPPGDPSLEEARARRAEVDRREAERRARFFPASR